MKVVSNNSDSLNMKILSLVTSWQPYKGVYIWDGEERDNSKKLYSIAVYNDECENNIKLDKIILKKQYVEMNIIQGSLNDKINECGLLFEKDSKFTLYSNSGFNMPVRILEDNKEYKLVTKSRKIFTSDICNLISISGELTIQKLDAFKQKLNNSQKKLSFVKNKMPLVEKILSDKKLPLVKKDMPLKKRILLEQELLLGTKLSLKEKHSINKPSYKNKLSEYAPFEICSALRKYSSFKDKELLHDFMNQNGVDICFVNKLIKENLFVINGVAKSFHQEESAMKFVPNCVMGHIASFIDSSDIKLEDPNSHQLAGGNAEEDIEYAMPL